MTIIRLMSNPVDSSATSREQLLVRVACGDHPAFEELYRREFTGVRGAALRLVCDSALADEVAQEVMLYVWRHADQFDPARGSGRTWIRQLTRGKSIDRIRSCERGRIRDQSFHDHVVASGSDINDPERQMLLKLDTGRIAAALLLLSVVQREAVMLAYFSSSTYQEIAAALQLPVPTLKTRIRGGLIKLRRLLAEPDAQQAA